MGWPPRLVQRAAPLPIPAADPETRVQPELKQNQLGIFEMACKWVGRCPQEKATRIPKAGKTPS